MKCSASTSAIPKPSIGYQIANDIHKMVDAYIDVYKSIAPQKQSDL